MAAQSASGRLSIHHYCNISSSCILYVTVFRSCPNSFRENFLRKDGAHFRQMLNGGCDLAPRAAASNKSRFPS
eukprot:3712821-Pleurochrysis_carterae.AAC.1